MSLSTNIISLMDAMQQAYQIDTFVETGTYKGDTAVWAAKRYQQVITCEASFEIFNLAQKRLARYTNIEHHSGHSLETLKQVLPNLADPVLYWIDSHWSAEQTYGENDECPLLDELQIILTHSSESFIFVDDARYFSSPPPPPHDPSAWPNLQEIFEIVTNLADTYLTLYNDCIVIVPSEAKSTLLDAYQKLAEPAAAQQQKWWQPLLRR